MGRSIKQQLNTLSCCLTKVPKIVLFISHPMVKISLTSTKMAMLKSKYMMVKHKKVVSMNIKMANMFK